MNNSYAEYVPVFKAMSDETRLKILDMLSCGELCACKILEQFHITQPTLSYHMKMLVESGLVLARKEGSWMWYCINQDRKKSIDTFLEMLLNPKDDCICNGEGCCN